MAEQFKRNQKFENFLKKGKLPAEPLDFKATTGHFDRYLFTVHPNGEVKFGSDYGGFGLGRQHGSFIGLLIERKKGFLFVLNADYYDQSGGDYIALHVENCSLSFNCVQRLCLADMDDAEDLRNGATIKAICDGTLKIVDLIPDDLVTCKSDKDRFDKRNSPGMDYNIIYKFGRHYWHRPASFLLQYKRHSYILGRDEEQYFGVELPKNVTTIKQGFDSLKPESIRKRKNLDRQGEWFAVPVPATKVPKTDQTLQIRQLILPVEPEGNPHTLESKNIVLGKNDQVFCREFGLSHMQHQTLEKNWDQGWFTFIKNTAVRSVSQDGVD